MTENSSITPLSVQLYSTDTRTKQELRPLHPGTVQIYTCGPTVYGDQHIGNYRTFIFEDILVRTLTATGYMVKRVMNITDVGHLTSDGDTGEDKLEVGAARDGSTAWEVAKRYQERFEDDMRALGVIWPDQLIRATDTIQAQIDLIVALEAKGAVYRTADGMYFDSAKFPRYGAMAHLDIAGLEAGNRVEMGEKRSVTDFALWKFSGEPGVRQMEWESPWGLGFPGWHIECSAIIKETLGETIDIHCGGVDHIQVHHTNEIAQSELANQAPLANIWMHGEFLLVDGGKMSKSLGNIYTLSDLAARGIRPAVFRLFTCRAHYRSKLNFTWEGLAEAGKQYTWLCGQYLDEPAEPSAEAEAYCDRALQALRDDCNAPQALAIGLEAAKQLEGGARRHAMETIFTGYLGVVLHPITNTGAVLDINSLPEQISQLVTQRNQARADRNWQRSDEIRDQLLALGYEVLDGKDGSTIQKIGL